MRAGRTSDGGNCAIVSFNTLIAPFSTTIQLSLTAGLVVASPIWLYQLWAFVAPGLHKSEKRYTYAFVGAAVPCSPPVPISRTSSSPSV